MSGLRARCLAGVVAAALAASMGCTGDGTAASAAETRERLHGGTARENLDALRRFLTEVVDDAAPEAVARPDAAEPTRFDCGEGEVHYTWVLPFDVPAGERSDTVLADLVRELDGHGFALSYRPDTEQSQAVVGSSEGVDLVLVGSHRSRRGQIQGSSACGPVGEGPAGSPS